MITAETKILIFDMDGTLTQSQALIHPTLKVFLESLTLPIAVISGATVSQMKKQIPMEIDLLGQSGNEYFNDRLTVNEELKITQHINKLIEIYCFQVSNDNDLIQRRGCQVSFSLKGHNEKTEIKRAFDPSGKVRRAMLENYPFEVRGLKVSVGGTTCFDYVKEGCTKGDNIRRYLKEKGIDPSEALFFGDQLYKGGNDESVNGVCPVVEVDNPPDIIRIISNYGN